MDILEFLNTLIATLDEITVKGKDNLDKLLGCIISAENMRGTIKNGLEPKEEPCKGLSVSPDGKPLEYGGEDDG